MGMVNITKSSLKQGQRDGELRAGCGANCEAHAWTSKLCNNARHLSSSSSSVLLRSRRIDKPLAPRWRKGHAQVRGVRAADCGARRGFAGCILHCLRSTPVRSVLRPAPPPAAAAWRRGSGARRWRRRIHSGPGTAFAKEEASNALAPGVCRARCLARRRLAILISLVACGVRRPGVKAVLSRQQHETARLAQVAEPRSVPDRHRRAGRGTNASALDLVESLF